MSGKSWIQILFLIGAVSLNAGTVTHESTTSATAGVRLLAPAHNARISYGNLTCVWMTEQELESDVVQWELRFIPERRQHLSQSLTLSAEEVQANGGFSHHVDGFRRYLRLPGIYRWQVVAILENGNRLISPVRNLIVGVFDEGQYFGESASQFELRLTSTRPIKAPAYRHFVKGLANDKSFRRYSDFDFVFHQGHGVQWHVKERVFFHSQMGIGGGLGGDFSLLRNGFFSLNPQGSVEMAWRSEGLQNYANTTTAWRIGFNLIIMPSGCVTLQASYLPDYRVRYASKSNQLSTFEGKGWEAGFRLVFSRRYLKPFRLMGVDIDFQRMPITYHMSEIEDRHSGIQIKHIRLSLGYIF